MSDIEWKRGEMLEHADAIACYLATRTTLTASQAYGAIMTFINSFEDANRPSMSELKPCPFCGGEAHAYRNHLWHVGCERALNGCVTMSAFVTEADAINAWNTRAERKFEVVE